MKAASWPKSGACACAAPDAAYYRQQNGAKIKARRVEGTAALAGAGVPRKNWRGGTAAPTGGTLHRSAEPHHDHLFAAHRRAAIGSSRALTARRSYDAAAIIACRPPRRSRHRLPSLSTRPPRCHPLRLPLELVFDLPCSCQDPPFSCHRHKIAVCSDLPPHGRQEMRERGGREMKGKRG